MRPPGKDGPGRNIEGIPVIKQAKREADMGKSAMLVHTHDGDIDHLPAPIATKCDRCGPD
jgi:hypothetical protein